MRRRQRDNLVIAMMTLCFVDSLDGVHRAQAIAKDCVLASDNPLLAHDPAVAGRIDDTSRYLDQRAATRLGHRAIDILLAIDEALEKHDAAARYGGRTSPVNVTIVMRALLATLMQRGTMAAAAARANGDGMLHIMGLDAPRWMVRHPWTLPRFASPLRPLAEHGFFGNRRWRFDPVATTVPAAVNDTAVDDPLLRARVLPMSVLAYEAAHRIGLTRIGWRRGVAVGKSSEALRETLPWLALRGHRLARFNVPDYAGAAPPSYDVEPTIDPWLNRLVAPIVARGATVDGLLSAAEGHAIGRTFMVYLSAGMASLAQTVARLDQALENSFNGYDRRRALVTSGIYGPMGTQLHALCRSRRVPVIDFEHGATTGLAHTSERRLRVSEASSCDLLAVSSDRAAGSFRKARRDDRPRIQVIGLADQTRRVLGRGLQRQRARRRLGLGPRDVAVMHISTLLYGGNMRPGDDSPTESYVFETEKTLLTEVYGDNGKSVLFKPYPTQRFVHQPSYDMLFDLPPGVRLIDWADFRYVRAAADIIVTGANSSTIGWCVGADVPLVHLGSRIVHRLVDDALADAFRAAFFCVDMDAADWPTRLRDLLGHELSWFQDGWREMRAARRALLTEGIVGPQGSVGRRAARLVEASLA